MTLDDRREMTVIWSIEDVQEICPDLSEGQCWEVLQDVERNHNADIGISWGTLELTAEDLFGFAPNGDDA